MLTIASHSQLNISETVTDKDLVPLPKVHSIGNGLRGIKWSRDRLRRVTLKDQTRDPNICFEHNTSKTAGDAL